MRIDVTVENGRVFFGALEMSPREAAKRALHLFVASENAIDDGTATHLRIANLGDQSVTPQQGFDLARELFWAAGSAVLFEGDSPVLAIEQADAGECTLPDAVVDDVRRGDR